MLVSRGFDSRRIRSISYKGLSTGLQTKFGWVTILWVLYINKNAVFIHPNFEVVIAKWNNVETESKRPSPCEKAAFLNMAISGFLQHASVQLLALIIVSKMPYLAVASLLLKFSRLSNIMSGSSVPKPIVHYKFYSVRGNRRGMYG